MSISKIKEIKIREEDGSYSDAIPVGVDAINADYKDTNVENELDKLNNENKNRKNDISILQNKDIDLQNQIKSLASGSPKGIYTTVNDLITANPDTGVYIVTKDGHIYSWTKNSTSNPIDLGIYQAMGINNKGVELNTFNDKLRNDLYDIVDADSFVWCKSSIYLGNDNYDNKVITTPFIYMTKGSSINFDSINYKSRITLYDDNKNYVSNTGTYKAQESYTLDNNYFVRIGITKSDDTPTSLTDGNSANVQFIGYIKKEREDYFTNYNDELTYEKKTIDDKGNPETNQGRLLSNLFSAKKGTLIKLKKYYKNTRYQFAVDIYSNNGVYQTSRQWSTNDYTLTEDCKIRIRISFNGLPIIPDDQIDLYKSVIMIFINKIEESPLINKSINLYECSSHRGYFTYNSIEIPENTIAAYKYSVNKGFDMIETDVRFTSDNIPIICHDETINRTARNNDGTELTNNIYVNSSTFDILNQYDYGVYVSSQYASTPLLTFEEVCKFAKYNNIQINIDSKSTNLDQISIMYNIIKKYGLQHKVRITVPSKIIANHLLTLNSTLYIAIGAWTPTTNIIDDVVDLRATYPNARIIADFYAGNTTDTIHEYLIEKDVEVNYYVESNNQVIKAVNYGAIGFTINLEPPYEYLKSVYENN